MKKWLEDELKTRRQQLFDRQYMEDYYSSCGVTRTTYYLVAIKSTVCDEHYEEEDVVLSPIQLFNEDINTPNSTSHRMVFIDLSTPKYIIDYIEVNENAENSLKGICGIPKPDNFKLEI